MMPLPLARAPQVQTSFLNDHRLISECDQGQQHCQPEVMEGKHPSTTLLVALNFR